MRTLTAALIGALMATLPSGSLPKPPADVIVGSPFLETGQGPVGADEWLSAQRIYPHASLDLGRLNANAHRQAQALRAGAGPQAQAAWQSLGPATIGGRITDIVVDPVRANTIYAAAASGGVWKSTDSGSTFHYSWNPNTVQAIGALAISGTGVLYAGTGESNPGGGSSSFPGTGMYRSTDAGATWQSIGLTGTDRIGRIAIDPTDSNRIFVAATGNLFVPGGPRGLYRTTDGGATWQLVLAGANSTTGATDVALNPADPDSVYVAMWDHYRTPVGRNYGGVGSGIFRSTNGGTSFTRLGGGLPSSSTNLGRMGLAVGKSDPNRLYAIAANTSGNFLGFWTSANRGDTWTAVPASSTLSNSQSTFGWWFGRIWVDPANASHLWVAGVPMLESTNAGNSWTSNSSSFHVDQHALGFDPRVSGRVFIGNDGGVYRSTANGSLSGGWSKGGNLSNLQFYTVAVSQQDPSRISGGLQDNGSVRSWSGWGSYRGGDGLQNLIDPTNHLKVYACSQNGSCGRSTNGGNSMSSFGSTTSSRRAWLTPVVFDPSNPAIMYYGGNQLNRSTNSAQSFTAISGDLSRGSSGSSSYNTISTIAVAKTSGSTIYVGTDDGRMWITRNTGGSWTEITSGLPNRWITRVAVDPTDANLAYVTLSGYRNGESDAHVYRTGNGGSTWQNISGNLPDAPVNDIVLHPQDRTTLFVGTDVGVFTSSNGGVSWQPAGTGLPQVSVMDLETSISSGTVQLTAGTYGLGVYRLSLTSAPGNDFSISASPASGSVNPGSSVSTTISTATTSGSAQTVSLTAGGLPSGATASFNPTSVTSGGSSTLTIATTASTPAGVHTITVTGTGSSVTRTTTYQLTVNGTGGTCTGYESSFSGTLASGANAYHPNGRYFYTANSGQHRGCVDGPTGSDFDLYLQKWNGSNWTTVASGTSSGPDESFTYNGTAGYYRYRVHAYSGSGAYTGGYDAP